MRTADAIPASSPTVMDHWYARGTPMPVLERGQSFGPRRLTLLPPGLQELAERIDG